LIWIRKDEQEENSPHSEDHFNSIKIEEDEDEEDSIQLPHTLPQIAELSCIHEEDVE
jgi:hypothetical protein